MKTIGLIQIGRVFGFRQDHHTGFLETRSQQLRLRHGKHTIVAAPDDEGWNRIVLQTTCVSRSTGGCHRDKTRHQLRVIEDQVRDLRSGLAARRSEAAAADMTAKESVLRLEHQDESIREKWSVDLATWTLPPLEPEPESEITERQRLIMEFIENRFNREHKDKVSPFIGMREEREKKEERRNKAS